MARRKSFVVAYRGKATGAWHATDPMPREDAEREAAEQRLRRGPAAEVRVFEAGAVPSCPVPAAA